MAAKKIFIFDLDGTLVDAYRAIAESLNFALQKFGHAEAGLKKVKASVGRGDKLFIKKFFPSGEIARALKVYRAHHKKALPRYAKLIPGAKHTLRLLRKKKRKVCIASNRPKYFTNILLRRLSLKRYIDLSLCADEISSLKPSPKIIKVILKRFRQNKKDAVFIGDMDIDLETAKRAGVDAVYLKGGSSKPGEVRRYKSKKTIAGLREIIKLYG